MQRWSLLRYSYSLLITVDLISLCFLALLGFLFPVRSYPSAVQLLSVLNLPATDISYWQTTSPLDAVSDLLVRLQWSSIAVISQSKQALLTFSKKASERSICIVAQTVLSPINRQALKQV